MQSLSPGPTCRRTSSLMRWMPRWQAQLTSSFRASVLYRVPCHRHHTHAAQLTGSLQERERCSESPLAELGAR